MMKSIVLCMFPVLLSVYACTTKAGALPSDKENALKTFITTSITEYDSTNTVDSLRLLRIDTLNERDRLLDKVDATLTEMEQNNEQLTLTNELLAEHLKMMRLTVGLSDELYQNATQDFKKEKAKAEELIKKSEGLKLKLDELHAAADKADTVQAIGYAASFRCQVRRADKSVLVDTVRAYADKELNPVRASDFIK